MKSEETHNGSARDYDVVLYGATGFTGRHMVSYFAQHAKGVRWALGGRNKSKLENVRRDAGPEAAAAGIVVADANDAPALNALARSTRVVLSTAGPYSVYGTLLVEACVDNNTHYVDISGETPWVRGLIDRFHAKAAANGTRIIPFCGVDSVPSDVGTWFVAETMVQRHDVPCAEVKCAFIMRGAFNGGTVATALSTMERNESSAMADPFLLNPTLTRPVHMAPHRDPVRPLFDKDFRAWLCPFFMSVTNTRAVRRSVALVQGANKGKEGGPASPYGTDFVYQEYWRAGRGARGAARAGLISLGTAAFFTALRTATFRRVVAAVAPSPGEGPSQRTMERGFLRGEFYGHSTMGHTVHAVLSESGDPSNRITSKYACEAALALVHNLNELPGGPTFGGVLTPVSGLGNPYVARLREAGTHLKTVEKPVAHSNAATHIAA